MPDTDRIIILAQSGVTIRQAEAAIGRKMTEPERVAWDRVQVKRRLERAAAKRRGPESVGARVKRHRKLEKLIPYADPEDLKRRKRLEKDPAKWLRYYLEDRFPEPFGEVHKQIITACIRAMVSGTSITVA